MCLWAWVSMSGIGGKIKRKWEKKTLPGNLNKRFINWWWFERTATVPIKPMKVCQQLASIVSTNSMGREWSVRFRNQVPIDTLHSMKSIFRAGLRTVYSESDGAKVPLCWIIYQLHVGEQWKFQRKIDCNRGWLYWTQPNDNTRMRWNNW